MTRPKKGNPFQAIMRVMEMKARSAELNHWMWWLTPKRTEPMRLMIPKLGRALCESTTTGLWGWPRMATSREPTCAP